MLIFDAIVPFTVYCKYMYIAMEILSNNRD